MKDVKSGSRARDRAMDAVQHSLDNHNPDWRDEFIQTAVGSFIEPKEPFTTDDIIEMIGHPPGVDHRASGPLMKRLQMAGLIYLDGIELSKNPKRHRAPVYRWRPA